MNLKTVKSFLVLICALALGLTGPDSAFADGWATQNGGTTGGTGGPVINVSNLSELTAAINQNDHTTRIVRVNGIINLGSSNVRFGSNLTIEGVGSGSGFFGNLKGVDESNIVIRNINFTNPNDVGDGDGLTLDGCTNVIVENCEFVDCGDGSLDVTHGSDFVTVRYCIFSYTFNSGHNFVNLIGHSDNNASEDTGHLKVTFHNNWWSTMCVERMPRVRFGQVHVYNNYFNAPGNNYCLRGGLQAQLLSENNYFQNIDEPYDYFHSTALIEQHGDFYDNCTNVISANDNVFNPPYSYSLQSPSAARSDVIANAGVGGGGNQTPTPTPTPTPTVTPTPTPTPPPGGALQAENAALSGGVSVESNHTGFFGSGFVNFPSSGGAVTFNGVSGGSGGTATITIRFALGASGSRTGSLVVNGSSQNITFNSTGAWNNWTTQNVNVNLNSGSGNTIGFQSTGQDLANLDQIAVSTTGPTPTPTPTPPPGGTTATFVSIAAHDGRIQESSETSNTGGSVDSSGSSSSTLRVGDDSSDRQYKTFLSFDTSSIPDGATVTAATVRMTRGNSSGTNPFGTHGTCLVDVIGGNGFSGSLSLQAGDFQAGAGATQVATMSNAASSGDVSAGTLNATGRGQINKTGHTQFRIYFSLDDNDDNGNDYVGYRSGNDSSASLRPTLEVTYQ